VAEEETPEGLLLTLKIRQESEVLQWLLGWGRPVHVLEPESLRTRIKEEAAGILRNQQEIEAEFETGFATDILVSLVPGTLLAWKQT